MKCYTHIRDHYQENWLKWLFQFPVSQIIRVLLATFQSSSFSSYLQLHLFCFLNPILCFLNPRLSRGLFPNSERKQSFYMKFLKRPHIYKLSQLLFSFQLWPVSPQIFYYSLGLIRNHMLPVFLDVETFYLCWILSEFENILALYHKCNLSQNNN